MLKRRDFHPPPDRLRSNQVMLFIVVYGYPKYNISWGLPMYGIGGF